jgi:hypothetical protein
MTLLLSLGAALLGTALPLAALALVTRWRLARGSARLERRRARIPRAPVAEPEEASPPRLGWLRETIGRDQQLPTLPAPTLQACPRCGSQVLEGAFFCRRCGAHLRPR